jgi:hypothetical protein
MPLSFNRYDRAGVDVKFKARDFESVIAGLLAKYSPNFA